MITEYTNYFNVIDTPQKAYYVGFIAADGNISDNGRGSKGLEVNQTLKDSYIVEYLRDLIAPDANTQLIDQYNAGYHSASPLRRLKVHHPKLVEDLNALGIYKAKTHSIGDISLNIPEHLRPYYAIGYIDGDGSISFTETMTYDKRYNKFRFKSRCYCQVRGTEELLQGIVNILCPEIKVHKDKCSMWKINFARKDVLFNMKKYYEDIGVFIFRKYYKLLQFHAVKTISSPSKS